MAAALIVLAGTVVAWALSRAAERVPVVSVARPVQAGDVLTVDDFTISEVAIDADVRGLVPASSLPNLAGRVATIDLSTGMLVSTGMWAEEPELQPDERTIGAVLRAGRFPSGLVHGATAWAIDVRASISTVTTGATGAAGSGADGSTAESAESGGTGGSIGSIGSGGSSGSSGSIGSSGDPTIVRVLDAEVDESGDLHVTLAVPAVAAVQIASLAATDTLALAGVPTSVPTAAAPGVVTTLPGGAP